jgi:DNA processing protein
MTSELKNMPLAAVVGSREVDDVMMEKAKYYTEKLVGEGFGIVSGGAIGIDEISHETALKNNAYTVAVIANGIDVVYPLSHKELFERIKEKGLLITELMVGAKPQKSFFPTRNRLIAAMADIVVALPASNSSGTYITVNWARKLGKKVICEI